MKAVIFERFRAPLAIRQVSDPLAHDEGAVIRVRATGICRSDWHGWMGNDADIKLPHVPGHEFSGEVELVGKRVTQWRKGDRVTVPFVCGCGMCPQCEDGNHQVCDRQSQPGFTHWGSFAEYVAIDHADINLVRLPDEMDFVTAASLGCRFITSFRGVVNQGRVSAGQYVAVHGCGGVGLSAIMIAFALGAQVVAIDISDAKLSRAKSLGALVTINSLEVEDVVDAVKSKTNGGAHVSIDALGSPETCRNSISNLRKRGRHVQIGIMEAEHRMTSIPMDQVLANELEIVGSHGMQAHKYPQLFEMISCGSLRPGQLVGRTIALEDSLEALKSMNTASEAGMTVIDRF